MNIGCIIEDDFINHLLYANDMDLISASIRGLQYLIGGVFASAKKATLYLLCQKQNVFFYVSNIKL